MKIQRIKLLTDNLKTQEVFYTYNLGLKLVGSSQKSFTVQVGDSHLTFEEPEILGENPFYHFAIDIPGNKINESINWLNLKGISLNSLPNNGFEIYSETWNATSIYFYDTVGNVVEFIARHDLENNTSIPFSSNDLINLSEIGLVVSNVPEAIEILNSQFSIACYKNNTDKFAAIGNEDGLFILTEYNRVWLGSNKNAKYFKTEVLIEETRKGVYIFKDFPYNIIGY